MNKIQSKRIMDEVYKKIDIREDYLAKKDNLLELLLVDKTTKKNILWATDSYQSRGEKFSPKEQIKPKYIIGTYWKVIQPRAAKSKEEQMRRRREKAEVFTPLSIVKKMNEDVDKKRVTKNNWQEYVSSLKLEITCGEAPYITSRYDPVSERQEVIPLKKRVGFLDKKLKIVSRYCDSHKEWIKWAKVALQSSYGYDWQGDNVLLARENVLYTFIDFYKNKFKRKPSLKLQKEMVEIITWNIFQMDGLRFVVPMSCKGEKVEIGPKIESLFDIGIDDKKVVNEKVCEGCRLNNPFKHNGKKVKIMDWKEGKVIRFVDLLK